jgi:alpha-glucoside transport system permease protein
MDNIAGTKSGLTWAVHIASPPLSCCGSFPPWAFWCRPSGPPTRSRLRAGGPRSFPTEQTLQIRAGSGDAAVLEGDLWVIEGNFFEGADALSPSATILSFGVSSRAIGAFAPGRWPSQATARPSS